MRSLGSAAKSHGSVAMVDWSLLGLLAVRLLSNVNLNKWDWENHASFARSFTFLDGPALLEGMPSNIMHSKKHYCLVISTDAVAYKQTRQKASATLCCRSARQSASSSLDCCCFQCVVEVGHFVWSFVIRWVVSVSFGVYQTFVA